MYLVHRSKAQFRHAGQTDLREGSLGDGAEGRTAFQKLGPVQGKWERPLTVSDSGTPFTHAGY